MAGSSEATGYASGASSSGRSERPAFGIFQALLARAEVFIEFAARVDVDSLVHLYAMSGQVRALMNARFSTVMLAVAECQAPESRRIFRFKVYRSLCMPDPALRPHPRLPDEVRLVPSFRWLRMVLYREHVAEDIVAAMAERGHKMPAHASATIKLMWLMLDVPYNLQRIALFHNEKLWTDRDLYMLTLFLLKLDMAFNDPMDTRAKRDLRRLLTGQPSLTLLWKTLRGTALTSHIELTQLYLRFSYRPRPGLAHLPVFGVPPPEFGITCVESYGRRNGQAERFLLQMDDLLLREAHRRQLGLKSQFLLMLAWGYLDWDEIELRERERDRRLAAHGGGDPNDIYPWETELPSPAPLRGLHPTANETFGLNMLLRAIATETAPDAVDPETA
ncbi:MAG: hypothetical protein M1826_002741 [Phylliscum demangeonii]|nr:MAG: hypothetical protein M1826_002741 [Phylliscum demangeonii]